MLKNMVPSLNDGPKNTWGFAQLLEHIDIGILVLDLDKETIDYCNAAFYEMIQDESLCRSYAGLHQLFLADSAEKDCQDRASHIACRMSYRGRLFGFSVYQAATRYRCVFISDITEKSRLESIAQAVNLMDNIGFIFSGIRHEIGNPLNSLKMALSVLKQNADSASPDMLREYVERGLTEIGRIEYLLKALKTFSFYESVELKDLDLIEFMEKFISLVERDFHAYGIRIRTEIPLGLPRVKVDERALHQVLLNLFSNAADALTGVARAEIRIKAEAKNRLVWLSVRDNGCGISPEQFQQLFQPFNTGKPNGNGLGLVITRKLLALMKSDISISSDLGKGTEAVVRLPITQC